jgi:gliding motility-associated-like protein
MYTKNMQILNLKIRLKRTCKHCLWVLSIFIFGVASGQQFVNGGFDLHPDYTENEYYVGCSFYSQEYLDNVRQGDPTGRCFDSRNWLSVGTPNLYTEKIAGFDTLNFNHQGGVCQLKPRALNYTRFRRELHLMASMNLDTMMNFGWSMELTEALDPDRAYSLAVSMNRNYHGHWRSYDTLDFFQPNLQWYLRIGVSESPYIEGDSIGVLTKDNYIGNLDSYFRYWPDVPGWEEYEQYERHRRFKCNLLNRGTSDKYLTFKFISEPVFGDFITEPRSTFTCEKATQYLYNNMMLDDFKLEVDTRIEVSKTDTCSGDSMIYTLSTNTPNSKHLWSTGDTTSEIGVSESGTYWVQILNGVDVSTDTITVEIEKPEINIVDKHRYDLCIGSAYELEANYENTNWFIGDTLLHVGKILAYVPTTSESILVKLDNGCLYEDTLWIETGPCGKLYLPNAFSPNSDGLNELFRPITLGIEEYTMQIYNRYGQQIADLDQNSAGWDAADAPQGAYMVIIRAKGTDNEWYDIKSTVTVLK